MLQSVNTYEGKKPEKKTDEEKLVLFFKNPKIIFYYF